MEAELKESEKQEEYVQAESPWTVAIRLLLGKMNLVRKDHSNMNMQATILVSASIAGVIAMQALSSNTYLNRTILAPR